MEREERPSATERIRHERLERLRAHPQAGLVPALSRPEYEELRADIERRGLVMPLAVTRELVVLDGHERLKVARELGLERVPVRVEAPEDELAYMLLAALRRRQLAPSQRAALALELAEYEQAREEAQRRSRANLRGAPEVATLPPRGEKTRELGARLARVSPRTLQDAATVKAEDPDLFAQVKAGTLPAERAARRIRQRRQRAELGPAPPLPAGPFELFLVDPPWQLGNPEGAYAPENHYPTMPLAEIKALELPAAEDAVLFLWALSALLPQALEVIAAWGFAYKSSLVWVKPSIGPGVWFRNQHEFLLLARRGSYPPPEPEERIASVLAAPRGRHSEKPDAVYELLEQMYPHAAKLELFARRRRPGWAAWGNEVPE